jgi:signal transduction histidine kinase
MQVIQGMSRTIDDFRNFFRPDKQTCDFDIGHMVGKSMDILVPSLDNSNIKVVSSIESGLFAHGHPSQFSQVVLNILANAKEAIQLGGVRAGQIAIRLSARDGLAVLEIEDNGGGIPGDIIGKIFDPYFTSKEKGSGIGLYMSKTIIERNMDGSIEATNTPGGALFTVKLPLLATAEA